MINPAAVSLPSQKIGMHNWTKNSLWPYRPTERSSSRGGRSDVRHAVVALVVAPASIVFSWFGPDLFCLLLGPPGFNCWFSSAPVFQWCCSTPQGSPGVGRNTFLSSPHLCFIIVFICDLFVSLDDPLMS